MPQNKIYLDYAAATPLDDSVLEAMRPYFSEKFHNPSALYERSYQVGQELAESRALFAKTVGAKPDEIIFTAGATEANNIALQGLIKKYKAKAVCSAIEHKAVINLCEQTVSVDGRGLLELDDLEQKIADDVVVVSVMLVNNETGVVQDLPAIRQIIDQELQSRQDQGNQLPLYLHSDASQAANLLDLHIARLKVDMMTINSAKLYGPKQTAALYLNSSIELTPIYSGGRQERGLRGGTENIANIVGFTRAFKKAQGMHRDEFKRLKQINSQATALIEDKLPDVKLLNNKYCLPNFISLLCPGMDGERLVMALDFAGFETGTGAACSALENDSSHVIKALGYSEEDARSSLRISLGRGSKIEDVASFVDALHKILQKEQAIS